MKLLIFLLTIHLNFMELKRTPQVLNWMKFKKNYFKLEIGFSQVIRNTTQTNPPSFEGE